MLADLDPLMQRAGIGALIVPMHEAMHASFRWLTRGARVTRGYAIKLAGSEPLLVTHPMERDEAAATGLEVAMANDFGYDRSLRASPDSATAYAEFFDAILRERGAIGAVAFSGNVPIQLYGGIIDRLRRKGWDVPTPNGDDLIERARKRKDEHEINAIRSVGERTEEVVDEVRKALREWSPAQRLTIGDLKELVRHEIARRNLVEDHATILSQGRDAGVPHSRGNPVDPVRPSTAIVLDIFPFDRDSGYFFDLTRTFCIGPIPEDLRRLHADVLHAFRTAVEAMRPGQPAARSQELVCSIFERKGYPTTRCHPGTFEGYVHSLGHGVGLDIHERPSFALAETNTDRIEPGDILTIEPGLYFPDRAMGVRIEDTFVVRADGIETLCRGAYDLEP